MFNFCEVFVRSALVTGAGKANTCRHNFKASSLQKSTKTEGPSENMGFNGKII